MAESLLGPAIVSRVAPFLCLLIATTACTPRVQRTAGPPAAAEMAQLWIDPGSAPRDLRSGAAAALRVTERPDPDTRYDILSRDTRGFSITYRVRDARGREWNVKIGPEAQTEVVTSRIVWALGYHQLPSFFVERWIGVERGRGEQFGGARFRPRDLPLTSDGSWSWQQNPFVGAPPYNGLIVLMMILNSTDLKNENNELYTLEGEPREGASRWYVVKDLGASLGESGRYDPRRGDITAFEREPFTRGVESGRVRFGYRGRHQELLASIGPDAVRWTCERLSRITDRQWADAFAAGNFDAATTSRYVARIKQKIGEGLALR